MSDGERSAGGETFDAQKMLDTWRGQGADRLDPIRFHLIEGMARRAANHSGDARRILDARLEKLLASYGEQVEAAVKQNAVESEPRALSAPGPLAGLADGLVNRARPIDDASPGGDEAQAPAGYPELPELDYFRELWARLGTKRQLKQSLEKVPENAGPLNSSLLVHRTLSLMGEVSPDYLHHFLSYVDALAWVEQATGGDLLLNKDAQRTGGAKKGQRAGSR